MIRRWLFALVLLVPAGIAAQPSSPEGYPDLLQIFSEIRALDLDRLEDLSSGAFEERAAALPELRNRLGRIDASGWEVEHKVDYLLVRSRVARLYGEHAALRPWRRDPGFYVDRVASIPFVQLPLEGEPLERWRVRLTSVPAVLAWGRENLIEGAGQLTRLALRNLERHDGVGHGHPRREVPPAGVIGWYRDLLERARRDQPSLAEDIEASLAAVEGFRDWLRENLPRMNAKSGIGAKHYDWHLINVLLMPFDGENVLIVGERERQRALAFLALEQWRNRDLPPLEPATSEAAYEERVAQADRLVREFLRRQKILTLPEGLGPFDHNVPWTVRPGGRNFWEEIQYRDPLPDHVHAVVPGHRFDAWMQRDYRHPIRAEFTDSGRVEGWAFYLEEMLLQSGLLEDRPRTRELFYVFQAARAVRNRAEVALHLNRWNVEEAVQYMVDNVPFMDSDVARVDCEIYLRRPGYGISYLMGRVQIEQLLADRRKQLGEDFDLAEFHDRFLAAGRIPIALTRWEMTGLDDQAEMLWSAAGLNW